jgi:oligosaccharide repeat unit polymerase
MAILAFFLACIWLFAVVSCNREYACPAVIISTGFLISGLCALYNEAAHGVTVSSLAQVYIGTTCLLMVLICTLVQNLQTRRRANMRITGGASISTVVMPRWLLVVGAVFSLLTLFLYWRDMANAVHTYSSDWQEGIRSYRMSGYSSGDFDGLGVSSLTSLCYHLETAITYVFAYVMLNNFVLRKSGRGDVWLLVPAVVYAGCHLLAGERFQLLQVFLNIAVMWLILYAKVHPRRGLSLGTLAKIVIVLVLVGLTFYALGSFVGRNITSGPLDYIAGYFGYSYACFGMWLESPTFVRTDIFAPETLAPIYRTLSQMTGDTSLVCTLHFDFRVSNGVSLGNLYSACKSWISDYGVAGMYGVTFLYALLISGIFHMTSRRMHRCISLATIVYSFFGFALFDLPLSDNLSTTLLASSTVPKFIVMYVLVVLIDDFNKKVAVSSGGDTRSGVAAVPNRRTVLTTSCVTNTGGTS